mmetsp:Transcript_15060/g.30464  ORF Transcript_15060/g.30464 Transcript_15060/m.30464 type:complete len:80 (+) Transcript_15060:105-344(+)
MMCTKDKCFYVGDKNLYFTSEDCKPLQGHPVKEEDISMVVVRCLSLMGWGEAHYIKRTLTERSSGATHRRLQAMYALLK